MSRFSISAKFFSLFLIAAAVPLFAAPQPKKPDSAKNQRIHFSFKCGFGSCPTTPPAANASLKALRAAPASATRALSLNFLEPTPVVVLTAEKEKK